ARGEVLISPGEAKEVKFTLSRSTFSVNVKTEPEDALVYVNDKLLGKGSFRADVEAGKVKFRVEREGYEAVEREVVVDRDDLELKFVLNRIVVWTKMRLNGNSVLSVAFEGDYVGPRVTAESKGVQTPEYGVLLGDKGGDFVFIPVGVVDVSMGMDVALKPGRLTIVSNVDGADVYVDNRMIGKLEGNKFTLDLKPGKHLVELRKDRYTSARGEVLISPGEAKEVKFTHFQVLKLIITTKDQNPTLKAFLPQGL
ncbi:PEGA domain-containing protein, partial [Candidatus Kryptonium thompsonii]